MSAQASANNNRSEVEQIEQIKAADWTDMDLLTRDLAGELLDTEIDAEEQRLTAATDDPELSDEQRRAAVELRERRIRAMREVRSGLSEQPDPAATSPAALN
ncbi:hypothetical protein [Gordonia sp. KTR9]|uniref:hypothetical protein n=1 Tax=Gordonia sp. KTR9 TaxID=337191 RepID=UPI0005C876FC|nr:hypothetical protein [Gordonia sp. KTR9]